MPGEDGPSVTCVLLSPALAGVGSGSVSNLTVLLFVPLPQCPEAVGGGALALGGCQRLLSCRVPDVACIAIHSVAPLGWTQEDAAAAAVNLPARAFFRLERRYPFNA